MDQTDIWMLGVIVVGVIFYACTVYFEKHDVDIDEDKEL